jgi:flavin reductase (DIM6/NTAB) family NADH-FMN oxidoreductase RutF
MTATTTPPVPVVADAARSRQAMRRVASGVGVLTVRHGDTVHGTTVSALVEVSRSPVLLGCCLRAGSVFAALAVDSGLFSVSVLAADQHALADHFADPARGAGPAQFAGLDIGADPVTGAPLLRPALAHLACRVTDAYPAGDHTLLLATVLDGTPGTGVPLLSFAGALHAGVELGEPLVRGRRAAAGRPQPTVRPSRTADSPTERSETS